MNIQPMIDELLLIRRGLGGVGYNQGTFGRNASGHPCGTVCCMAGIAMFKKMGRKYLYADANDTAREGALFLGLRINSDDDYEIFGTGSTWPDLIREMLNFAPNEETRIDAAICALRLVTSTGKFRRTSEKRQREVIAQRLAEVAAEEQELSELGKLLKEVELELNRPETDRKLLRKDKDLAKKAVSKSIRASGRKLVATQDRSK